MSQPIPQLPEKVTLNELGVSRPDFIKKLGGRAEKEFLAYRNLMMRELNKFLEDITRVGIASLVDNGDGTFTITLDNGHSVTINSIPGIDLNQVAENADLAERWATEAEDVEVTVGEYSALHHAAKSSASASDASDSAELAEQWAENPEDVEVEAGKYSAKHHAAKSEESATESAVSAESILTNLKPTVKGIVKATAKGVVKPTTKGTVKATEKAAVKPTSKASVKATSKGTIKSTTKATVKETTKGDIKATGKGSIKETTKAPIVEFTLATSKATEKGAIKSTTIGATKATTISPIEEVEPTPTVEVEDAYFGTTAGTVAEGSNLSKALVNTTTASEALAGVLRYREEANASYLECCMETEDGTYTWVLIKENTWI